LYRRIPLEFYEMAAEGLFDTVNKTATFLFSKTHHKPEIGIICGSGLGTLVEVLYDAHKIPYGEIPDFPKSTVAGHAGNLVFGVLGGKSVVCMQGRFHPYEGYNTTTCTFPVRVMKAMGVKVLIATNACGGLNQKYNVGDIVVVKDHINLPGLAGQNPLFGPNEERFGPRFLALSDAYDREYHALALEVGKELNLADSIHSGVYCMQWGPCYETVAECRLILALGGDVVGMSTTHEVIVARHMNMRVLTLSLVTNKAILEYDSQEKANHEEVMETSKQRAEVMKKLVENIVMKMQC
jgi:purine-nucleoside phosphorylase